MHSAKKNICNMYKFDTLQKKFMVYGHIYLEMQVQASEKNWKHRQCISNILLACYHSDCYIQGFAHEVINNLMGFIF